MLIKRFEGASIQEVLREVRAELGPDAIVLSQRSRPAPRSWLGVRGQAVVEVTAAVDREQTQAPAPHAGEGVSPVSRTRGDESWRPLQLTRALIEPLEDEIRSLRAAIHEQPAPPQQTSLAAEVAEIRALVEQLLREPARPPDDPLAQVFLRAGLQPDLAQTLADDTALRTREGQPQQQASVAALAERIERRLALPRLDHPRSQLVIGAPGVGKTTSLAKLAQRYRADDVRLFSAGATRPGASACLRATAAQCQLPFEEIPSPDQLAPRALRRGTVLVDTPGFVGASGPVWSDLQRLRRELGPRGEVQLVISATTREVDLQRQVAASAGCEPDSLVVTRVDETEDLAHIVNLLFEPGAPRLAWLGCGQAVPDDLTLPDGQQLAARVLGAAA